MLTLSIQCSNGKEINNCLHFRNFNHIFLWKTIHLKNCFVLYLCYFTHCHNFAGSDFLLYHCAQANFFLHPAVIQNHNTHFWIPIFIWCTPTECCPPPPPPSKQLLQQSRELFCSYSCEMSEFSPPSFQACQHSPLFFFKEARRFPLPCLTVAIFLHPAFRDVRYLLTFFLGATCT